VSGTKEFGLEQNLDGSYNFYTRGVDRVTEWSDEFVGELPCEQKDAFEGADALWTSLQDNLVNYINNPNNGGSAVKDSISIERPNWDDIRDVLNGVKSIGELGCN